MVGYILLVIALSALDSLVLGIKRGVKFWNGDGQGSQFFSMLLYAACFVFETWAFIWLWQLDNQVDLNALAEKAGL